MGHAESTISQAVALARAVFPRVGQSLPCASACHSCRADEVLVSSTVKDLVAGSGIVFDDRGEHQLKGVPGTWPLYAVQ